MADHDYDIRLMRSIRRIIRAVDLHSKALKQRTDFTTPQLVCLTALAQKGPLTLKGLSEAVDLSPSTALGIVDRLHAKGLVERRRGDKDRRQVMLSVTEAGQGSLLAAPYPLQHKLLDRFNELSELEQSTLTLGLERLVELLGARDLEASAILDVSPIPQEPAAAGSDSVQAEVTPETSSLSTSHDMPSGGIE